MAKFKSKQMGGRNVSLFEPLEARKLLSVAYPAGVPSALPGTIQAENFDNGGAGVAYHDTTRGNTGGAYRSGDVDIGATNDAGGGQTIGWVKAGEWLNYTVTVAEAGTYRLDMRVASAKTGGTLRIEFDGVDKTGTMAVPSTGDWGRWATVSKEVTLEAGTYTMRVVMLTNGATGYVGNFNWYGLTRLSTPSVQAPAAPSSLTATAASSSQINLAWVDNSFDESGFRVERSTDGSNWSQAASLAAGSRTYSATGLSASTRYYFRVVAYNSAGNSPYSNTANATTQAAAQPPPSGDEQSGTRPGPENTGPTNPSAMVASGSFNSAYHGQVIENRNVTGVIYINHNNVTLRNFRIDANGNSYAVRIAAGVTGTVFEDGEVTNFGEAVCYGFTNYTARRLNVHHAGKDGFKAEGNVLIEWCWVHHLGMTSGAHADGVQSSKGSGLTIRYNNFDMPIGLSGHASNAAVLVKSDFGPIDNVLIQGNWMNGGNYTIFSRSSTNYGAPTNVRILDNRFGRNYRYGLLSLEGNVQVSGNCWDDNGQLINTLN